MSVQPSLRVHIEFGQEKLDFEGTPDEVFKAFTDFVNKMYPAFEVARQLVFMPDIRKLAESLVGVVEIGMEGPILISGRELSTDETILFALLGSYIGNRLAKLQKSSLSSNELSKTTGKAYKTIMNQLPKMLDDGSVEKIDKEYKISDFGIIQAQNIITNYKASKTK
jgi:hypothetical protein